MIGLIENEFEFFEKNGEHHPLLERKPPPARKVLRRFALEVSVLLFYLGMFTAETIVPNEILRLLCIQKYENQSKCDSIGLDSLNTNDTKDTNNDDLQSEAARIFVISALFSKVIPAIATFFIMAWSDKYGRKTILVLSFFGSSLSIFLMFLNAQGGRFSSPWNYAYAHIPNALVGASATKSTIIFSYISDVSSPSEKSSRLLFAEIVISIGTFLGTIAVGYLSRSTSAESIFLISLFCLLVSSFWCIIYVDESLKVRTEESKIEVIRKLFSFEPVTEMKRTLFRKRNFSESETLWSIILIQTLVLIIVDGERSILYLFTTTRFNWTLADYSMFNSTITLLAVAGNLSGIFIFKQILKFSDSSLLLIATVFRVIDSSFKVIANSTLHMYIISIICLLKTLQTAIGRSLLSSFIPKNEIGKVFTVLSFSETFGGFIGPSIYTKIYLATFKVNPGSFYALSSFFEMIILCVTIIVIRLLTERNVITALLNKQRLRLKLYKTTHVSYGVERM